MTQSAIRELLTLLNADQTYTLEELSFRLGMDRGLLAQLLQVLQRSGYLQCDTQCASSCGGSHDCGSCHPDDGTRVWSVTAKGLRAVRSS